MRFLSRFFCICLLLVFIFSSGCSKVTESEEGVHILVTVAPIAGLVKDIAGETFPVTVFVPPGKEPETFMPTPSEMLEIAKSNIFFRVGLPSEDAVLNRLTSINPKLRVVDLREGLPVLNFDAGFSKEEEEHKEADHLESETNDGDHHHHHHGETDPHVWMSLANLRQMSETVLRVLIEVDPGHQGLFTANAEEFQKNAESLQKEITEKLSSLSPRILFVFHPAYGWYCKEFGLKQRAVESGGKSPKAKDLVALMRQLSDEKAQKIFVQPEFSQSAADKIAETLNIRVEVHSPLEEEPLDNIRHLTEAIVR